MNTGSIWPAIALHAQCNLFGFPSFANLVSDEFRMSTRIFVGLLYLGGAIAIYCYFDWFTLPAEGD